MDFLKVIAFLLSIVVLIIVAPLISIWALNTLFGLQIVTSIWTWLAMTWLHLMITNGMIKGKIKL